LTESSTEHLTVYVFGAGQIASSLVVFAKELDFTVVVIDDREEFATRGRFPRADEVKLGDFVTVAKSIDFQPTDCVVIITHEHQHDETVLKECLSRDKLPGYIGMIGNPKRIDFTFSRLKDQGSSTEILNWVNAPIGLDIGAQSRAEIALSIISEMVAHIHGKDRDEVKRMRRSAQRTKQ
jgi:xanthine dehydrogenase accessory factor